MEPQPQLPTLPPVRERDIPTQFPMRKKSGD